MKTNPLKHLHHFGQSIWLDFIRRNMLMSGELKSMIAEDGLLGMTSNPSIFEKAITGSRDYDDAVLADALAGKTSKEIYENLTIFDIQKAADLFRPTYEKTDGRDGYVSLEVSPHLAYHTEGTIEEALRLWKKVSRHNLLIKVPGTAQGIPAIRHLISEGINVNVTLLFGLERYDEVLEAYLSGLELRANQGKSLKGIASVASFFLSRIDLSVDALLPKNSDLRGQIAIASAKLAYQKYKAAFDSDRFKKLKKQQADTQRLLWASTSTKDPSESDVKYVEALIGRDTINTLPLETLNAYRDHGKPESRLEDGVAQAGNQLGELGRMKIDLRKITQDLESDGVHKFSQAFDKLMTSLELKRIANRSNAKTKQIISLSNCGEGIQKRIDELHRQNFNQRLLQKDPSLWGSDPADQASIKNGLGWLHIADKMEDSWSEEIRDFVQEVRDAGFEHVVHMGMGGSSLAPLVFARTFSAKDGLPLTVLDTTDPDTLSQIEKSIPLEKTLFIVASKSGTTAEPLAFRDYFYERVRSMKGERAGENFVTITDPGTPLVGESDALGFRRIFLNAPDIGGRYSALSYFGMVPAALMGVNINEIINRALQSMQDSLPALILGATLGEMALQKRDKITLLVESSIEPLGLWLEQLMAESTGKEGKGLIPIANEPIGEPSTYGKDRLFVHITQKNVQKEFGDDLLNETVSGLIRAGEPVVKIELSDLFDLGREFFQWEFATAVAGSILGINAFNQPNVQESKDNTDRLITEITPHTLQENPAEKIEDLGTFLKTAKANDYLALMAFLPEVPETQEILQSIRKKIRDQLKLATTLGYGPRYLHSTGQLHKGGPDSGIFVQITADETRDVPIPGKNYTFGEFKHAQAQGDWEALRKHGRRVFRIHLGSDIEKGLKHLDQQVDQFLRSR